MVSEIRDSVTSAAMTDPRKVVAAAMESAATAWLNALAHGQRVSALFDSPLVPDAEAERLRGYYSPTDHGGLPLRDQLPDQQSLAMQVVASGLSRGRVCHRRDSGWSGERPRQVEGWQSRWARQRGRVW